MFFYLFPTHLQNDNTRVIVHKYIRLLQLSLLSGREYITTGKYSKLII